MYKESKARVLSFLYPAAALGCAVAETADLRQTDPAVFPFSSGVCPWPTGSAILYPPLVTRAGWGYWTSWALELSRAAASQHRQQIWLCASGFVLSGAKNQPNPPFSFAFTSAGQKKPAAVGRVRDWASGWALPSISPATAWACHPHIN